MPRLRCVPGKMFEPYTDKISEQRKKILDRHIHPIMVHAPQAFAFFLLFFSMVVLLINQPVRTGIYWLRSGSWPFVCPLHWPALFWLTGWKNTISQIYDPHSEAENHLWPGILCFVYLVDDRQPGQSNHEYKSRHFDNAPEYRLFHLQYIPRLARIKSPGSKIPRLIKHPLLLLNIKASFFALRQRKGAFECDTQE